MEKAVIRCVAFEGYDKRTIMDSKDFSGPLHTQYTQTIQWLKNKLDVRYDIEGEGSGPRKEIWEIPETVFKEAIINALSHRDYYEKGARITVELFKDRVEISNPGGLISGIKKSEFGKRSLSRNPLIFGLFEKMDLVEQIGSGVGRIRDLMEEAGLPAPGFMLEGMFTVTLLRPVDFETWINSWKDHLTENRVRILELIHQDTKVTKEFLSSSIGVSTTAIDNNIKWLRQEGFVERIGGDKKGIWKIIYK
ncbi:MAG: ATP-binding protein [Cyclobacteriaceae bacterium]